MMQHAGWSGARSLLRRLRDVMAGGGSAQQRLDQVARLIAAEMVAEVCSIYIRRAGDVLELFATEGLNKSAVHITRLAVGEGLVGDIAAHARPLALADAQAHPAFAYRPETGEEIYHSMLGVPVVRGGRVLGVLVIQNRTLRNYGDEEVETMETVAMVLAELVASGELVDSSELRPVEGMAAKPLHFEGIRLSPGVAIGHVALRLPYVAIERLFAEDPSAEDERLTRALETIQAELDGLLAAVDVAGGRESRDILEAHSMFARDLGWRNRIGEAINSGLTAEAAVSKTQEETRRRMSAIADPYLRERMQDFDDLANRLLDRLMGGHASRRTNGPADAVLVARSLGPAELLEYPRDKLRAVVVEEGSPTSHVAIVARALDIPVVGDARGVLSAAEPDDEIVVDGDNGHVFVRPGPDVRAVFAASMAARQRQREAYARMRELPAVSRDGVKVSLQMNAGLLIDLPHLDETGAEGIGLYRTEIPFMVRSDFPDIEAQEDLYRRVLVHAGERPVIFRTLDIGGDKPLPYFEGGGGENPALGWRALRISLDRPAMLQRQLQALLRAAAGRELRIMFPMVAEVAEFDTARAIVGAELAVATDSGTVPPSSVKIGVMLEVPALVWQLDALLERADFISVGSNDLIQFLFASDRGDPRMVDRYDPMSPPVLSLLRRVVEACDRHRVQLSVCGEIAGDPLDAMALIALGFRTLSMAPPSVGPVKAMLRRLDVGHAEAAVLALLERPDHSVRQQLQGIADDQEIPI